MRDIELQGIRRRTQALYDHQAANYADRTRSYELFPGLIDEIHRFVAMTRPGLPAVDLGCGAGRDTRHLLELGCSVVALDLSRNMVKATGSYCEHHPRLGLVQADMSRTPFHDVTFGGAWICASLLHLPSRQLPPAMDELQRILAPGAGVSISMKAGTGEGWRVGRLLGQTRWFTFVQPDDFAVLLRQHGFVDVRVTPSDRHEWFITEGRRA